MSFKFMLSTYHYKSRFPQPGQVPIKPIQHFHLPPKTHHEKKIDKHDYVPTKWSDYFD